MVHPITQLHDVMVNVLTAVAIGGLSGLASFVVIAALSPILVRVKRK